MQESKPMKEQMHIAAQYLAAANMSFLKKKEDDSHTNLGFDISTLSLETYELSPNEDKLSLHYNDFSLEWSSQKGNTKLSLDGKKHHAILEWLQELSKAHLSKEYMYEFHYDLPYSIEDIHMFTLTDPSELDHLAHLRALAQNTIAHVVASYHLDSPIRIWPHHFDTGAYASLDDDSGISIGIGLAIPDSISETHYFYISGYNDQGSFVPPSSEELSMGKWLDQDFKGAVLPATGLLESEAIQFFKEAIHQYRIA
ncbi:hypothetical protein ACFO3O_14225 [Dokdonia ponticola]|uniref:DUF4132 domain-containing protein n=1 Tax=Dokdonia ponticola TaxID=2041041 RepID=A0ABV9I0R4_9FLAO